MPGGFSTKLSDARVGTPPGTTTIARPSPRPPLILSAPHAPPRRAGIAHGGLGLRRRRGRPRSRDGLPRSRVSPHHVRPPRRGEIHARARARGVPRRGRSRRVPRRARLPRVLRRHRATPPRDLHLHLRLHRPPRVRPRDVARRARGGVRRARAPPRDAFGRRSPAPPRRRRRYLPLRRHAVPVPPARAPPRRGARPAVSLLRPGRGVEAQRGPRDARPARRLRQDGGSDGTPGPRQARVRAPRPRRPDRTRARVGARPRGGDDDEFVRRWFEGPGSRGAARVGSRRARVGGCGSSAGGAPTRRRLSARKVRQRTRRRGARARPSHAQVMGVAMRAIAERAGTLVPRVERRRRARRRRARGSGRRGGRRSTRRDAPRGGGGGDGGGGGGGREGGAGGASRWGSRRRSSPR